MTTFCANLWATKVIPSHLSQYWGCLSWCVAQHWGTSALHVLPFQVKCFHCQVTAPQTGIHVPSQADPRWRVASGTFDCSGIPGRIPTQWEGAWFNTLSYKIHRSHSAFIWCSKLRPNITITCSMHLTKPLGPWMSWSISSYGSIGRNETWRMNWGLYRYWKMND